MVHSIGKPLLDELNRNPGGARALVVQGGAMRGIYSMAVLYALQEIGIRNSFQNAFASSAGALNIAYMLAGQARAGVEVYLNHISNRKFIDPLRFWKIADIDFLIDSVVSGSKELNLDLVKKSETDLHIYCTNAISGSQVVFSNHEDVDLLDVFRASAGMPVLYNRWTAIRDEPLVDGGVSNNIPLIDAMNTGCRDVLAIVTKPLGDRHDGIYGIKRILYGMLMGKYPPAFRRRFLDRDELYNRSSALLDGSLETDENIFVIHPSDPGRLVSRATTSRKKLLDCAMMGVNDCRRYFGKLELENIPFGTD